MRSPAEARRGSVAFASEIETVDRESLPQAEPGASFALETLTVVVEHSTRPGRLDLLNEGLKAVLLDTADDLLRLLGSRHGDMRKLQELQIAVRAEEDAASSQGEETLGRRRFTVDRDYVRTSGKLDQRVVKKLAAFDTIYENFVSRCIAAKCHAYPEKSFGEFLFDAGFSKVAIDYFSGVRKYNYEVSLGRMVRHALLAPIEYGLRSDGIDLCRYSHTLSRELPPETVRNMFRMIRDIDAALAPESDAETKKKLIGHARDMTRDLFGVAHPLFLRLRAMSR